MIKNRVVVDEVDKIKIRNRDVLPLRACVWNLNGLKSSKVQKLKSINFDSIRQLLDHNDLICFSETWRDLKDDFQLDLDNNFLEFHKTGIRRFRSGRASGGMSLLIRTSIAKNCSIVQSDSYHIWCQIDREAYGWESDLFICFLYIPPSTSNWFKSGESLTFDSLQEECSLYENKGWVLLFGDTNARTGNVNDFIENDEIDEFLPVGDNYQPDTILDKRINDDESALNTNGTSLIEFCKSTGFRILNGRVDKKHSHSFTYFNNSGNSVVDYALLKEEFFHLVNKLRVGELSEFSDHCPLQITIKASLCVIKKLDSAPTNSLEKETTLTNNLIDNYKTKFLVDDNSIEKLISALKGEEVNNYIEIIKAQLDDCKSSADVDKVVNNLRSKLLELSENNFCAKKIFTKNKSRIKKCAWFDEECKTIKTSLNKARKSYQDACKSSASCRYNNLDSLRTSYFSLRREYKKLLKRKRKFFLDFEKEELWDLKSESPKAFWKKLSSGQKKVGCDFSKNELFDYFNNLLTNNDTNSSATCDNLTVVSPMTADSTANDETQKLIDNLLNSNITFEEVERMTKKLKSGKATGLDMINAELLKNLNNKFLHVFVSLFNKLLQNGHFPEEWAIGIIVLIFKGGEKDNLDNYRGITLLSIFGKLFIGILLQRLNNVVSDYEILCENQLAYRKGYQTSDHIFTLRAVIENTFQNKKGALYLCFVDFKKAFDSVDHKELLHKLATYGIKGNFLKIIASLYSKVKSSVRGADGLTDLFSCSRGVRQGCLLSPLLFALFLNDLNNYISTSSVGVKIGEDSIHSLLYADDLVLIARDPVDLQSQLNALQQFINSLKMEVNISKTKIMVLKNKKRKSRAKPGNEFKWYLGNIQVKECESYKYLGVTFKSNGSFTEHVDKVREKAQKSYYSLLAKSRDWGGFQPRLFLYLFDHTIIPILNYASDVWGTSECPKLERLHLSASKYALGVKSSTNTDAVYSELGRMSIQSYHHVNILKFYIRLSILDNKRYASKAFEMLVSDADSGCSNWVSTARNLQQVYDVQLSDNNSNIKTKVQQHFQSVIMGRLKEQIIQDKKLKTYAKFKTTYKFEAYLDTLSDFTERSCFAKFRLSAHNLQIEIGRFGKNKTPRSERYCAYCKTLKKYVVEDEVHFLTVCPLFEQERQILFNNIYSLYPSTRLLNNENMFLWLLSQEDRECIHFLAKFCKRGFKKREKDIQNLLIN